MTIKDAITVLNCVEAHGICIEAKEIAIRSLEAWLKVSMEINEIMVMRWDYDNNIYIMSGDAVKAKVKKIA